MIREIFMVKANMQLIRRLIEPRVRDALDVAPVVLIHGPRQSGKTTLAKQVGKEYDYFTFDDPEVREYATYDPKGFIKRLQGKTILDEIQRVPELFLCIKQVIDEKRIPGQFLVTGSANILRHPKLGDSLAGRIEIINLLPFSYGETRGEETSFLQKMYMGGFSDLKATTHLSIEKRVVHGGYPTVLNLSENEADRWYSNYLTTIIKRDIPEFSGINAEIATKLIKLLATRVAQEESPVKISNDLGISFNTYKKYISLLQTVFLIEQLSPWHSNLAKRLIKSPKIHMVDTGLVSSILNAGVDKLISNRNLMGQLLENYVYCELRRQANALESRVDFYHMRTSDQQEIDIVIEGRNGHLYAIEIKSAASTSHSDFKHIRFLADKVGEQLKMGVVFYDGELIVPYGDRMWAVPLSYL